MTDETTASLVGRLRARQRAFPLQGGGSTGAAFTSYVTDDGMRLINPDGPEAADALESQAAQIAELEAERDEAVNWNDIVDRHGTDQYDDLAERWLGMEAMQRFFQAHCSTFAKWSDDQLMARYRQSMSDIVQLAFVEGALVGVRSSESQRDTALAEVAILRGALDRLRTDCHWPILQYEKNGPSYTSQATGVEYEHTSYVQHKMHELIETIDNALLTKSDGVSQDG